MNYANQLFKSILFKLSKQKEMKDLFPINTPLGLKVRLVN